MINTLEFYKHLSSLNIGFFTGVPDSILKYFINAIVENTTEESHIISANEGSAVSLGVGYHLATQKIPLVYMQNSGLGNAVNPLLSMADQLVYKIPMLLMVGYRGMKGIKDEPQHKKQGLITEDMLNVMGIKYEILSKNTEAAKKQVASLVEHSTKNNAITAMLVGKDVFDKHSLTGKLNETQSTLNIDKTIQKILQNNNGKIVFSTTGKISRRIYKARQEAGQSTFRDFLSVGGMGHVSQIASGFALFRKNKKIICIDGDGSLIMHMGGLSTIGQTMPNNLVHILINNECHDSVGGQKTAANIIDFNALSKANGYKTSFTVETEQELNSFLSKIDDIPLPAFINIKVGATNDDTLPRPENMENRKKEFINFWSKKEK